MKSDKQGAIAPTHAAVSVRAPGRINIIGEHTDYNDGFVLPAAIDKQTTVKLSLNGSPSECKLHAINLEETLKFNLDAVSPHKDYAWANYLLGVVHELQQLGASFSGFDCEVEGNIPLGSGMSSSAALECCLAVALNELFELGFDKMQLIKAAQLAEHHYVGTKCGIMDQFASVMGKKNHVVLLDCRTLEYQYFPLDLQDYQLLLINTNVSHSLASSEYNTRRAECESGIQILQANHPDISHLRDLNLEQLTQSKSLLSETVFRRCKHVISENERVLRATQALQAGDIAQLGSLMYQSHKSLQYDYEVSCPELDYLVQQTQAKDYILGARMMGGGFGGCTINIIRKDKKADFIKEISSSYEQEFGIQPTPYEVFIEDGASII